MLDKILQLDSIKGLAYLLAFSALLAPGTLYFYFFQPEIFLNIELGKLVLVSLSLSVVPFFLFIFTDVAVHVFKDKKSQPMSANDLVIEASAMSFFAFFLGLFIWWLGRWLNLEIGYEFLVYWYLGVFFGNMLIMISRLAFKKNF